MYLDLMKRLDKRPNRINATLNSPGGSLCTGLAIYDRLKMVKDCTITANGDCSSAALVVLQAAKLRRATPSTTFVIHLAEVGCECESCQKDSPAPNKESMAIKTCLDVVLQRTYRRKVSEDNLIKALRQNCFDAQKALEWGFVDEVWDGN
jgi:ATP-dependent protease ClpP protease subunit